MDVLRLLGATMGLAFVSGINLYATVLAVGLGIRLDMIHLHPHLQSLAVLGDPGILLAAGFMYAVEFFADKVPWVDTLWDTVHTFIRPLGAAIIGASAIGTVEPRAEIPVFLLCGATALTTHATKASTRLIANHSPEPFSNIALSLGEDVVAVGGTWLSLAHPGLMTALVLAFLVVFVFLAPRVTRILRVELIALKALVAKALGLSRPEDGHSDPRPDYVAGMLPAGFRGACVRCVSGRGLTPGRNFLGFLYRTDTHLVFVTRKLLRPKRAEVPLSAVTEVWLRRGLLFDELVLQVEGRTVSLLFFKDGRQLAASVASALRASAGLGSVAEPEASSGGAVPVRRAPAGNPSF